MHRILDRVFYASGVAAALMLAFIAVLMLAQIVGRMLGFLISAGTEFAGFCMAASAFLALAWTLRTGGHIRVNLFVLRLPPAARWWIEAWCLAIAGLSVGALAVSSVQLVWDSYRFGDLSTGLVPVALWIPQLSMAVGVALLEVAVLEQLYLVLRGREPTYRQFEENEGGIDSIQAHGE